MAGPVTKGGLHVTKMFGDRLFDSIPDHFFAPGALYHKKSRKSAMERYRQKKEELKWKEGGGYSSDRGADYDDFDGEDRGYHSDHGHSNQARFDHGQSDHGHGHSRSSSGIRGGAYGDRSVDYDMYRPSSAPFPGGQPPQPGYAPSPTFDPARRNSTAAARYTPAGYAATSPQFPQQAQFPRQYPPAPGSPYPPGSPYATGYPATAPPTTMNFPPPPIGNAYTEYEEQYNYPQRSNSERRSNRRRSGSKGKKDKGHESEEDSDTERKDRQKLKDRLLTVGTAGAVAVLLGAVAKDIVKERKEKERDREKDDRREGRREREEDRRGDRRDREQRHDRRRSH